MRAFDIAFEQMGDFPAMEKALKGEKSAIAVSGCGDSQKMHIAYGLGRRYKNRIIATYSDMRAREIYEDFSLYDDNTCIFPTRDLIFYQADIHGNRLELDRMKAIKRVLENRGVTLITTFDALMTCQVPLDSIRKGTITIMQGEDIDTEQLSRTLVDAGYERLPQVEAPGQFSVRGGIIDIFDLTSDNPVRIELWGDVADSVRIFDVGSQRSIEELDGITVYPATEMVLTDAELSRGLAAIQKDGKELEQSLRESFSTEEAHRLKLQLDELSENISISRSFVNLEGYIRYFYRKRTGLLEYFDKSETLLVIDEPARTAEHARAVELEFTGSMSARLEKGYAIPGQADIMTSFEKITAAIRSHRRLLLYTIQQKNEDFPADTGFDINGRSVAGYNNSFQTLVSDLSKYKKEGYRALLMTRSRARGERLAKDLWDEGIIAVFSENGERDPVEGEVMVTTGHLRRGFVYPLLKLAYISENDIFGSGAGKKKKRKKYKDPDAKPVKSFGDLSVGDYVIHENHGLGIYRGIEKIEMEGITRDYMKLEYGGGGTLYVLAQAFDSIQKYAAKDAKPPKLNKLGSVEWSRTKEKVKTAVAVMAHELIELYAARQKGRGFSFEKDTVWQQEFEETFPFEETRDQLDAIRDTKKDMESGRIMDRLICGDVGYGKTEVALRAAFKAIQSGKQVALLVPTTILAQQHYNTFIQRMKDFPVNVGLLSRFRSANAIKETIAGLKAGTVDIVIGTHRLLSKDVQFKDLGLLVVDEEQRFGVTHKEKIKTLKTDVDVLTLSATPIPRTLHMSLSGIRDMSVLEEPPQERMPVQTFVCEYNEELVREAIVRELSRGGQVYYVYNNTHNIGDIAARVQALVPEATVTFAHGKMNERQLEAIMYDFIDGEIDVLISTTIIETGLDIPNVNTIIIHDSDRMGLAQLYQLRGRVGRSNRTAYAFLMYKRDMVLREVAEKRLAAIREFTDLGSGFKIAMRDLEIRGAGNILGKVQHGHMEAVGYELYCRMLNDAVRKEKGLPANHEFSTSIDLDVDAFIPDSYILNEIQKLDTYKRISGIETRDEYVDIRQELKDRFGVIPVEAENLLRIAVLKQDAKRLYLSEVKGKRGKLSLTFREDAAIKPEKLPILLEQYRKALTFKAGPIPVMELSYRNSGIPEKDGENLLMLTEELLRNMTALLL